MAHLMETPKLSWNAVVVTTRWSRASGEIRQEFARLQTAGVIRSELPLLVAEDPAPDIGSGSSTLNALLIAAEQLCVLRGYTILTESIIQSARILIIHMGRDFLFEPCGKAFLSLSATLNTEAGFELPLTPFIHSYNSVTRLAEAIDGPGVWICGGDAFFSISQTFWEHSERLAAHFNEHILAFTLPAADEFATKHGVYCLSQNGYLMDILFQAPLEIIKSSATTSTSSSDMDRGLVPLVVALARLSSTVAISFLSLHSTHPLNQCTYLGIDSGAVELKLSLFFDFLLATCESVSEADFVCGNRCGAFGLCPPDVERKKSIAAISRTESRHELLSVAQTARQAIWNCFREFKTKAVFLDVDFYHYLTNSPQELLQFYERIPPALNPGHAKNNKDVFQFGCVHKGAINDANGVYRGGFAHFHVYLTYDGKAAIGFVALPISCETDTAEGFSSALQWLEDNGITRDDLSSSGHKGPLSWETAKLCHLEYVNAVDPQKLCEDVVFPYVTRSSAAIINWKKLPRMSVCDMLSHIDTAKHFATKRMAWKLSRFRHIKAVLINNENVCLLPTFATLCLYGFQMELLGFIDQRKTTHGRNKVIRENAGSHRIAAKSMACIADVLGFMANNQGGLRSGPAAHPDWQQALRLLANDRIIDGVLELTRVREAWLEKASPSMVIRAARHYEAASQIFIRKTVMAVKDQIRLSNASATVPQGVWVVATAAARIDIAGGWSDTPPITYEYGGAVVNAAIMLNGKKPIVVKCRKTAHLEIRALIGSSSEQQLQIFASLADVQCFNNPQSPGSLICATLVCAEIINPFSTVSLQNQLTAKLGGGLEIDCKTDLPQGSGLGTSSILAGALLAALWRLCGFQFDISSILHAVLYVEQLLTTGGGWQDQVGGLTPGIKIGRFGNKPETAKISVEQIDLKDSQLRYLNDHLLLIYTGKTRLAKNLLQEVIRNWYARKRNIVETVEALVSTAEQCSQALKTNDWLTFAKCARAYWQQKCMVAPGCEPDSIKQLFDKLYDLNLISAGWMAGAGGGGFCYLFTKQPKERKSIEDILHSAEEFQRMIVYEATIDFEPLTVSVSENG